MYISIQVATGDQPRIASGNLSPLASIRTFSVEMYMYSALQSQKAVSAYITSKLVAL